MHVVWIDSDVHRLVLKDRRVGPDLDGEAPFITQVYVDELLRADELNDPNAPASSGIFGAPGKASSTLLAPLATRSFAQAKSGTVRVWGEPGPYGGVAVAAMNEWA